jgi:hypothetical protein
MSQNNLHNSIKSLKEYQYYYFYTLSFQLWAIPADPRWGFGQAQFSAPLSLPAKMLSSGSFRQPCPN